MFVTEKIDEFYNFILPFNDNYKYLYRTVIAVKHNDELKVLHGRINFHNHKIEDISNFKLETDNIFACLEVSECKASDFIEVIKLAKNSKIEIDNKQFPLYLEDKATPSCFSKLYFDVSNSYRPELSMMGGSLSSFILDGSSIECELRAGDKPFYNFRELLNHLMFSNTGDSALFQIICDSAAFIDADSEIENGSVKVNINVSSDLNDEMFSLGYVQYINEKVQSIRGKLIDDEIEWSDVDENNRKKGHCTINNIDNKTTGVTCFLNYDNLNMHNFFIINPEISSNLEHQIYEVFDKDLKQLKNNIFSNRNFFEQYIALLLSLIGFKVLYTGKVVTDISDIVVMSPSLRHAAIVECTNREINNNGKLSKLNTRCVDVKKKLEKTHPLVEVLPVIVTQLEKLHIENDIDEASKYQISVLCKEDIEGLLSEIDLKRTPEEYFEIIKSSIPSKNNI